MKKDQKVKNGNEEFPEVKLKQKSIQQKESFIKKKGENYYKAGTEMSICCTEKPITGMLQREQ